MDYKISIIIPVFNAENTLNETIKSIVNQSFGFNNIELILVDDASEDNSREIITKWVNSYSNIKSIFFEKNTGFPSIPRNIGIKNSNAPYLIFMDSDDCILKDYCETLYSIITKENADVVNSKLAYKFLSGIYIGGEYSKEYYELEDKLSVPLNMCGNIYKSSLIKQNNIQCPNAYAEDTNFSVKAYTFAKKMINMPNYYGYCYKIETRGNESLTHNIKTDHIEKTIEGYKLINEFLLENNLYQGFVFNIRITYLILSFFKFRGSIKTKLNMLKNINSFEKYLNYPIKIKSPIFRIINHLIKNEYYGIVIFISYFAGWLYRSRFRNFIYFKFFGLKKLEF